MAKSLENSVIFIQLHQLGDKNLETFPLPLECNQLNALAQCTVNKIKKHTSLENETKQLHTAQINNSIPAPHSACKPR